jgi:oligoribonuclease (3'-5' exoribonuclease)
MSSAADNDSTMLVTMKVSELRQMVREECAAVVRQALDPMQQKWVGIEAVASHAGTSIKTIRRWITAGMPATRVMHAYRFRLTDVDTWLAHHRAKRKT